MNVRHSFVKLELSGLTSSDIVVVDAIIGRTGHMLGFFHPRRVVTGHVYTVKGIPSGS